MKYIMTIISMLLSVCQILNPYWASAFHGEDSYFEDWSASQAFTEDYAETIEKDPDKDFVILSLTDIQLDKWETYDKEGRIAHKTIDELIEKTDPDLIVLPGDNAWSTDTYIDLVNFIDSYSIPWAPVMGNHDGQGCISEFWCAYEFADAEHCLFKFGPKDMGYGNYIVNITENGQIIHSIFLMDTHSDLRDGGNINGEKDSGYDHLWENQLEWYKWAVNGISALAGKTVESTVVFHIPVVEYRYAWEEAYDTDNNCFKPEYADTSFGVNHENVCCAPQNNGFFALCKELGSTKNMICGHDHVNCTSILYDGIRLTYSLKCGIGCYYEEGMSGGTTETISSDGSAEINHIFIDSTYDVKAPLC